MKVVSVDEFNGEVFVIKHDEDDRIDPCHWALYCPFEGLTCVECEAHNHIELTCSEAKEWWRKRFAKEEEKNETR